MRGIFNQSFFDCDELVHHCAQDDGSVSIPRVKEGWYRLTVVATGIISTSNNIISPFHFLNRYFWGIYIIVNAGESVLKLWHIGIPDKTAGESFIFALYVAWSTVLIWSFNHRQTQEYRIYWGAWDYPSQFPNGVNFTIGSSNESVDWNYIHWSRFGPTFIRNETVTACSGRDNGWNHQVLLVDNYFSTETGFYEMGTDDWLGWFQQEFGLFWDGLSGLGVLSNVMVGEICLCVRPTQAQLNITDNLDERAVKPLTVEIRVIRRYYPSSTGMPGEDDRSTIDGEYAAVILAAAQLPSAIGSNEENHQLLEVPMGVMEERPGPKLGHSELRGQCQDRQEHQRQARRLSAIDGPSGAAAERNTRGAGVATTRVARVAETKGSLNCTVAEYEQGLERRF
ncbi:hypothetical protein DFH05DRAFT_1458320 [Lentinula detonsa]|uniref:Rhamnogalacturonan lyase domain-containing protein n=1 Tax=Lentinula detonsa TaxID=2804962 RepID=A0A9W8P706_9AGAR|nr:hypothetical protein DFH05DRAFT_1458320 [Lentinula detonsa]